MEKELINIDPKKEISEFTGFAFKGRIIEMAVAFIIGSAFEKVVRAFASNLLMPIANFFIDTTGGTWRDFVFEPWKGMKFEVGEFLGSFTDFLMIAVVAYVFYVKLLHGRVQQLNPCPECLTPINPGCKKCPACCSTLIKVGLDSADFYDKKD